MDFAAIVEALKKIAADADDPDQAKAQALLDALDASAKDDESEPEAKADDEAENKAESKEDEKPADKDEDDKDKASGVSVSVNASAESLAALAAKFEASQVEIASLRAKLESGDKDKLFATYKVSAELKDFLSPKPLAEVEAILKHMKPQPAVNAALSGTVKTVAGKPELPEHVRQLRIDMGLESAQSAADSTEYSQTFVKKVAK